MKILFSSNAPWCPSGYGVQSKLLVDYFKRHNHEVVFLANFGLVGGTLYHEDVLYLPDEMGSWGNTLIKYYASLHKPDAIITLCDWFVFEFDKWSSNDVPWYNWTPIDLNVNIEFDRLQKFVVGCPGIVPMCQFGYNQIELTGRKPLNPINHAINSSIYKIIDKSAAKEAIGFPKDSYVIGMNMANKDASENRKAFDKQFAAVKKFIDNNSDLNVYLYMHTEPSPKYNGLNLIDLLKENEINLDKTIFTNPLKLLGSPNSTEEMAILYNSFDVLMNASSGEGFGVPIIEAQACGTPVLTHAATSMPELTFYGYAAKSDKRKKINIIEYGHRFTPNVNDMVKGLQHILEHPNEQKRKEVSYFVREKFDIDKIGLQWLNTLNGVNTF